MLAIRGHRERYQRGLKAPPSDGAAEHLITRDGRCSLEHTKPCAATRHDIRGPLRKVVGDIPNLADVFRLRERAKLAIRPGGPCAPGDQLDE